MQGQHPIRSLPEFGLEFLGEESHRVPTETSGTQNAGHKKGCPVSAIRTIVRPTVYQLSERGPAVRGAPSRWRVCWLQTEKTGLSICGPGAEEESLQKQAGDRE